MTTEVQKIITWYNVMRDGACIGNIGVTEYLPDGHKHKCQANYSRPHYFKEPSYGRDCSENLDPDFPSIEAARDAIVALDDMRLKEKAKAGG